MSRASKPHKHASLPQDVALKRLLSYYAMCSNSNSNNLLSTHCVPSTALNSPCTLTHLILTTIDPVNESLLLSSAKHRDLLLTVCYLPPHTQTHRGTSRERHKKRDEVSIGGEGRKMNRHILIFPSLSHIYKRHSI